MSSIRYLAKYAAVPALVFFALGCTETVRIQGVVTSAVNGNAIADATVTLHSADGLEPVKTNEAGFFVFPEAARASGFIVTVSADGYEPGLVELGAEDEGVENSEDAPKSAKTPKDTLNASVKLVPANGADKFSHLKFPVGGWVYAQDRPAAAAQVALWRNPVLDGVTGAVVEEGFYVAETLTADTGRFDFDAVAAGNYTLRVWPFDEDGDGLIDFRLTDVDLSDLGRDTGNNTGRDAWNQLVRLEQPSETIVASSFGNVDYPVQPADVSADFANAVLRNGAGEIFLHFGAEVDTELTRFELRRVTGAGQSTLVTPLTVSWYAKYIASIKPPAPLLADADATTKYELRILSLRFRSGAHPISPDSGTAMGKITFAVHGAPSQLANPTPALYVPTEANSLDQVATSARADATGVWLLDQHNDVYGSGSMRWTDGTGLALSWSHVAGAKGYVVYARNVFAETGRPDDHGPWKTAAASVAMPADTYESGARVVATGVLRNEFSSYGFSSAPWAYGNKVEFLVAAVNDAGFESPMDEGKKLVVKDDTAPTLTSSSAGSDSAPRGASVVASVTLHLSEAARDAEFDFVPVGGRIASVKQVGTTLLTATTIATELHALLKQSCTRLSVGRTLSNSTSDSDVFIPLDNPEVLGSATAALVFNPSGTFLGQLVGLTRSTGADHRYQGVVGDPTETFTATAGSQVCALTSPNITSISSVSANTITVGDAKLFAIGDTLRLFQPCVGTCASAVQETRTVSEINTFTNVVTLSSNVSNTYDATAIAFVYSSAVQTLRGSKTLALSYDHLGETLVVDAWHASNIYVGDTIVVDADGKPETIADQSAGQVTGIRIEDGLAHITTTLPGATTLVRGRATVTALGDGFAVVGLKDTSNNVIGTTRNAFGTSGVVSIK